LNKITCKVEECCYNKSSACEADEVEVCSCGCAHVTDASETACRTFRRS